MMSKAPSAHVMSRTADLHRLLPSPLLKASALVHLGAAGALAVPGMWPWALGSVAADHLLLGACGLWPRSAWLGPNLTRLPTSAARRRQVAVTIDDGPDPSVTPQVLEQLQARGAKATFFCIGERVARFPELAREIVLRGHSIENHSDRHPGHFSLLGPCRLAREIGRAQAIIASVSGTMPRFFRAPAGLRNPWLQPVLARLGLSLASWTRRGFDTVRNDPDAVLAALARGLEAGDMLLLHDGHAARMPGGKPVILEVLPRLLELLAAAGLTTVTLQAAAASVKPR
jgi:peptidoglycan/xylan/chitin deacetylase (PgdA/CDA1 family)